MRRWTLAILAIAVSLGGLPLISPAWAAPVAAVGIGDHPSDFNGDGWDDLALPVQSRKVAGVPGAGAVDVFPGSPVGLAKRPTSFSLATPGVPGDPLNQGRFGSFVAPGDFNGDGYADLAITQEDPREVKVLFGSAVGLTGTGSVVLSNPGFGMDRVAAGDFNGDGADDLLQHQNQFDAYVLVRYGSPTGFAAPQKWSQNSPGILDKKERDDYFGQGVAIGDFNGDGFDDMGVGNFHENVGDGIAAGSINVIYGSAAGLTATGNQFWHENSPGVPGSPADGDWLGFELVAGDTNGDGADELINLTAFGDADGYVVFRGAPTGLVTEGLQRVPGEGETFLLGDLDDDGFEELIASDVSWPSQSSLFGRVRVYAGSSTGLVVPSPEDWSQDTPGIKEVAEQGDGFGAFTHIGNYGYGPEQDLGVCAIGERLGTTLYAGIVNVIYGSSTGLTADGNQLVRPKKVKNEGLCEYDRGY